MKFYQKSPNLMIKVDYENQEVIVEFTGKILGNRYPELISLQTIEQCFRNIESLGFCKFNIALIMEGDVVSCDVTKDIMYGEVAKIHTYIQSHISNFNRYICRAFKNGNLVIEKNVTTKKIKKRMTIYNKETEMSQSANRKFVEDNALEGAFKGKCRFEMNLNSKEQIRQSLHIQDTSLISVLSASGNPIIDFLREAVRHEDSDSHCSDWKSYQRYLVLKDCDFDLKKVDAKIRSLYKRGTNFSDVLRPYRETYAKLCKSDSDFFPKILEMLK